MDARKNRLQEEDALALLKDVNELYAAKGKKVTHINLKKESPDPTDLAKLMLGPTGNLRAPTLRIGKKLVIGFHDEMYEKLLG